MIEDSNYTVMYTFNEKNLAKAIAKFERTVTTLYMPIFIKPITATETRIITTMRLRSRSLPIPDHSNTITIHTDANKTRFGFIACRNEEILSAHNQAFNGSTNNRMPRINYIPSQRDVLADMLSRDRTVPSPRTMNIASAYSTWSTTTTFTLFRQFANYIYTRARVWGFKSLRHSVFDNHEAYREPHRILMGFATSPTMTQRHFAALNERLHGHVYVDDVLYIAEEPRSFSSRQ